MMPAICPLRLPYQYLDFPPRAVRGFADGGIDGLVARFLAQLRNNAERASDIVAILHLQECSRVIATTGNGKGVGFNAAGRDAARRGQRVQLFGEARVKPALNGIVF